MRDSSAATHRQVQGQHDGLSTGRKPFAVFHRSEISYPKHWTPSSTPTHILATLLSALLWLQNFSPAKIGSIICFPMVWQVSITTEQMELKKNSRFLVYMLRKPNNQSTLSVFGMSAFNGWHWWSLYCPFQPDNDLFHMITFKATFHVITEPCHSPADFKKYSLVHVDALVLQSSYRQPFNNNFQALWTSSSWVSSMFGRYILQVWKMIWEQVQSFIHWNFGKWSLVYLTDPIYSSSPISSPAETCLKEWGSFDWKLLILCSRF